VPGSGGASLLISKTFDMRIPPDSCSFRKRPSGMTSLPLILRTLSAGTWVFLGPGRAPDTVAGNGNDPAGTQGAFSAGGRAVASKIVVGATDTDCDGYFDTYAVDSNENGFIDVVDVFF
jgi:hypothetical protein